MIKKLVAKGYGMWVVRVWMSFMAARNAWKSTRGLMVYKGDVVNLHTTFDFRE